MSIIHSFYAIHNNGVWTEAGNNLEIAQELATELLGNVMVCVPIGTGYIWKEVNDAISSISIPPVYKTRTVCSPVCSNIQPASSLCI